MRALDCHDFVAADSRYHLTCHRDFTTREWLSTTVAGRPVVLESLNGFSRVRGWLESEAALYSVFEVHKKMTEIPNGEDVEKVKSG